MDGMRAGEDDKVKLNERSRGDSDILDRVGIRLSGSLVPLVGFTERIQLPLWGVFAALVERRVTEADICVLDSARGLHYVISGGSVVCFGRDSRETVPVEQLRSIGFLQQTVQ